MKTPVQSTQSVAMLMAIFLTAPLQAMPPIVGQSDSGLLTIYGSTDAQVGDGIRLRGLSNGTIEVIDLTAGNMVLGIYPKVTSVEVHLEGGKNRLVLVDLDIPESLSIHGGDDTDSVRVDGRLSVGGDLTVALSSGNDKVYANDDGLTSVQIGQSVMIDMGLGRDTIELPSLTVGANFSVMGGSGNDEAVVKFDAGMSNRTSSNAGGEDDEVTSVTTTEWSH